MVSSCISISGPIYNVSSIKHPKTFSPISCSESRKCKCMSNILQNNISLSGSSSKIRAADSNFPIVRSDEEKVSALKNLLQPELMPKHLAVIMDGSRRWALEKGLPTQEGQRFAVKTLQKMLRLCMGMGIEVITVFVFSTENWKRSKEEVDFLMNLFEGQTHSGVEMVMEYGLRVSVIGDHSKLPKKLARQIETVEAFTKRNKGPHFVVALNYGGRQDILKATKAIAEKVKENKMLLEEINEDSFEKELQTKCTNFPCPDLLIRTGGEKRISNFLLWQMAYTELYFVDKFFPDFEEEDFIEAMISYQQRQRRFGGYKYNS